MMNASNNEISAKVFEITRLKVDVLSRADIICPKTRWLGLWLEEVLKGKHTNITLEYIYRSRVQAHIRAPHIKCEERGC